MPLSHLSSNSLVSAGDSAEKRLVATSDHFFKRFIQAWIGLAFVLWLLEFFFTPDIQYPGMAMMVIGICSLGLMYTNQPRAARWAFIVPACLIVMLLPAYVNGIRTPVLANIPTIIVLTGWLLGRKPAAIVSALFTVAVITYWAAEASGVYVPPLPLRAPIVWALTIAPMLVVLGVTIWALLSSYTAQLAREISLQRELDQALTEARLAFTGLDSVPSHVFMKDRQGKYIYANKAECDMLGRPAHEVIGKHFSQFFDQEVSATLSEHDRRTIEQGERLEVEERVVLAQTGQAQFLLVVKSPLRDASGAIVGLFGIANDITEKKRIEQALRIAHAETAAVNQQLASVLRFSEDILLNSPLPMAVLSSDGRCVQVNDAWAEITGLTRELLLNMNFNDAQGFETSGMRDSCLQAIADGKPQQHEAHIITRAGKELYCEYRILPTLLNGHKHLLVQLIDLSERKRYEEKLRALAFHDALTQLPNRRMLLDRLQHALQVHQRHGQQVAVLFLDLNRFKLLNDTHGHDAGDMLLVEVARRLQEQVRASDTVARLGGDEFVVLLEMPDTLAEQAALHATTVAEKIKTALSVEYVLGNIHHLGSASVGIKLVGPQDHDPDQILKDADAAMYQVKRQRSEPPRYN